MGTGHLTKNLSVGQNLPNFENLNRLMLDNQFTICLGGFLMSWKKIIHFLNHLVTVSLRD